MIEEETREINELMKQIIKMKRKSHEMNREEIEWYKELQDLYYQNKFPGIYRARRNRNAGVSEYRRASPTSFLSDLPVSRSAQSLGSREGTHKHKHKQIISSDLNSPELEDGYPSRESVVSRRVKENRTYEGRSGGVPLDGWTSNLCVPSEKEQRLKDSLMGVGEMHRGLRDRGNASRIYHEHESLESTFSPLSPLYSPLRMPIQMQHSRPSTQELSESYDRDRDRLKHLFSRVSLSLEKENGKQKSFEDKFLKEASALRKSIGKNIYRTKVVPKVPKVLRAKEKERLAYMESHRFPTKEHIKQLYRELRGDYEDHQNIQSLQAPDSGSVVIERGNPELGTPNPELRTLNPELGTPDPSFRERYTTNRSTESDRELYGTITREEGSKFLGGTVIKGMELSPVPQRGTNWRQLAREQIQKASLSPAQTLYPGVREDLSGRRGNANASNIHIQGSYIHPGSLGGGDIYSLESTRNSALYPNSRTSTHIYPVKPYDFRTPGGLTDRSGQESEEGIVIQRTQSSLGDKGVGSKKKGGKGKYKGRGKGKGKNNTKGSRNKFGVGKIVPYKEYYKEERPMASSYHERPMFESEEMLYKMRGKANTSFDKERSPPLPREVPVPARDYLHTELAHDIISNKHRDSPPKANILSEELFKEEQHAKEVLHFYALLTLETIAHSIDFRNKDLTFEILKYNTRSEQLREAKAFIFSTIMKGIEKQIGVNTVRRHFTQWREDTQREKEIRLKIWVETVKRQRERQIKLAHLLIKVFTVIKPTLEANVSNGYGNLKRYAMEEKIKEKIRGCIEIKTDKTEMIKMKGLYKYFYLWHTKVRKQKEITKNVYKLNFAVNLTRNRVKVALMRDSLRELILFKQKMRFKTNITKLTDVFNSYKDLAHKRNINYYFNQYKQIINQRAIARNKFTRFITRYTNLYVWIDQRKKLKYFKIFREKVKNMKKQALLQKFIKKNICDAENKMKSKYLNHWYYITRQISKEKYRTCLEHLSSAISNTKTSHLSRYAHEFLNKIYKRNQRMNNLSDLIISKSRMFQLRMKVNYFRGWRNQVLKIKEGKKQVPVQFVTEEMQFEEIKPKENKTRELKAEKQQAKLCSVVNKKSKKLDALWIKLYIIKWKKAVALIKERETKFMKFMGRFEETIQFTQLRAKRMHFEEIINFAKNRDIHQKITKFEELVDCFKTKFQARAYFYRWNIKAKKNTLFARNLTYMENSCKKIQDNSKQRILNQAYKNISGYGKEKREIQHQFMGMIEGKSIKLEKWHKRKYFNKWRKMEKEIKEFDSKVRVTEEKLAPTLNFAILRAKRIHFEKLINFAKKGDIHQKITKFEELVDCFKTKFQARAYFYRWNIKAKKNTLFARNLTYMENSCKKIQDNSKQRILNQAYKNISGYGKEKREIQHQFMGMIEGKSIKLEKWHKRKYFNKWRKMEKEIKEFDSKVRVIEEKLAPTLNFAILRARKQSFDNIQQRAKLNYLEGKVNKLSNGLKIILLSNTSILMQKYWEVWRRYTKYITTLYPREKVKQFVETMEQINTEICIRNKNMGMHLISQHAYRTKLQKFTDIISQKIDFADNKCKYDALLRWYEIAFQEKDNQERCDEFAHLLNKIITITRFRNQLDFFGKLVANDREYILKYKIEKFVRITERISKNAQEKHKKEGLENIKNFAYQNKLKEKMSRFMDILSKQYIFARKRTLEYNLTIWQEKVGEEKDFEERLETFYFIIMKYKTIVITRCYTYFWTKFIRYNSQIIMDYKITKLLITLSNIEQRLLEQNKQECLKRWMRGYYFHRKKERSILLFFRIFYRIQIKYKRTSFRLCRKRTPREIMERFIWLVKTHAVKFSITLSEVYFEKWAKKHGEQFRRRKRSEKVNKMTWGDKTDEITGITNGIFQRLKWRRKLEHFKKLCKFKGEEEYYRRGRIHITRTQTQKRNVMGNLGKVVGKQVEMRRRMALKEGLHMLRMHYGESQRGVDENVGLAKALPVRVSHLHSAKVNPSVNKVRIAFGKIKK